MDPLVQMIVDILRKGKENRAANAGGPMVGAGKTPMLPRPVDGRHDGVPYDEIVSRMETGR